MYQKNKYATLSIDMVSYLEVFKLGGGCNFLALFVDYIES